jgi:glutamine cyclotransferase
MRARVLRIICSLLVVSPVWADGAISKSVGSPAVCSFKVINAYPHDPAAFTQGLLYKDGLLHESTGRYGASSIRKVRLETGEVVQQVKLPKTVFGEGLTAWQDKLISVTWTSGVGFIVDARDLKVQRSFRYAGEGWGLASSDRAILMSDGSSQIRVLDPTSLQELRRINVTAQGVPVLKLNELEWVNGQIYANIWQSDRIARIDAHTGHVQAWIDLSGLLKGFGKDAGEAVLNGIAYDPQGDRLFVTGKLWPQLFEIELTGPSECRSPKPTISR